MRDLVTLVNDSYSKALRLSLFVGLATILLVLTVHKSNNYVIWSIANFLGGTGNDLFLIISNVLIIGWARRKQINSIIKLTLLLDFFVWLSVQGIKQLHIEPWYLRPNGGVGGFPSGHATHAFGMAFLLTLFFPRFASLWYGCAIAISWSRVETDWHTGFQVMAGVVLGISLVWGLVVRWLRQTDANVIKQQETVENRTIGVQQSYAAE